MAQRAGIGMTSISQAAFTGGELSPRLNARDELPRYQTGLSKLLNAVVWPHGGLARRMGTQFVNAARDHEDTRLIPFIRARTDAYILAFSPGFMRVHRIRGTVLNADNNVYEIATPYGGDDLDQIDFAQSADTIFLTHPDHNIRKLVRTDHNAWTLSTYAYTGVSFGAGDYPRSVAFFQQRLVLAGTRDNPKKLWFSRTGDLDAFSGGSGDSAAFSYVFDADDSATIRWARANRNGLVVGTDGGLWTISPPNQSSGFSKDNIIGKRQSRYGVSANRPALIDTDIYFTAQSRTKIRAAAFELGQDIYKAPNQTLFAEHLGRIGLNRMAWQEEPDGVLWVVADDGSLVAATVLKEQDVIAFHRHVLGGRYDREYPVVEDVAAIPSPDGKCDDVWLVVRRTVNGATVRHIEHMQSPFNPLSDTDRDGMWFLDCALRKRSLLSPAFTLTAADWGAGVGVLTADAAHFSARGERIRLRAFSGLGEVFAVDVEVRAVTSPTEAAVTILGETPALLRGFPAHEALAAFSAISGAEHIEGETAQVVVDGATHPDKVVSGGGFTLDAPGFDVIVGLPYMTEVVSLDLLAEGPQGSARAMKKRIVRVDVDLYRSQGAEIGVEGEALEVIEERDTGDAMDRPPALFSGVRQVNVEGGHAFIRRVHIRQTRPLPLQLRAIIPKLEA